MGEVFERIAEEHITDDELTILNEISNGRNDPHDVMEHVFAAVENEMRCRED